MIQLKKMLLMTSVCIAFNSTASHQGSRQNSFSEMPTLQTIDTSEMQSPSIIQSSNMFTTIRYGVGKWFVGETAAGAFFKMHQDGTLKGDVMKNPGEAVNRLSCAVKERFHHKTRTVDDPENQSKIYKIFTIAEELKNATQKDFQLTKICADEYNPLQKEALEAIVDLHAKQIQPQLKKEREDAIQLARDTYKNKMNEVLEIANQAAFNKRYLHKNAHDTTEYDLQDTKHYTSIKSYVALLKTKRAS